MHVHDQDVSIAEFDDAMGELDVQLHEHRLREIDPEKLPYLDFLHGSPDCSTYSRQAQGKHKRGAANGYAGVSPNAQEAAKDLEHFVRLLRRARTVNPEVLFTLENPYNPAGGMHHQPLIKEVLEKEFGAVPLKVNCTSALFAQPLHLPRSPPRPCSASPPLHLSLSVCAPTYALTPHRNARYIFSDLLPSPYAHRCRLLL
jgi:hypothetical protein